MSEKRISVSLTVLGYRGKSGLRAFYPLAAGIRVNPELLRCKPSSSSFVACTTGSNVLPQYARRYRTFPFGITQGNRVMPVQISIHTHCAVCRQLFPLILLEAVDMATRRQTCKSASTIV